MHLYNLTLQKPTGIVCAITSTFSSSGSQELVVARGKLLELLRLDKHGCMQNILSVDVFGAIRSLANLTSQRQKDYIVVGSDSGLVSILAYNEHDNVFEHIHKETVGKSGCRRIVPGQYLALDPKGRALMIAACEKQKLVYVLNRDSAAHLTISSPLEAHKSCTITYSIVGVDCGWDDPVFAALELDYFEPDLGKHLTFYELDLGLNHVYRKSSQRVGDGANMLVAVPGGGDGPSGVLVCAENFVIYKNQDPGHPDVCSVIPRRTLPAERGVLIVSATMHKHKSMFFFLLQTEYGDVFKVTLHHDNEHVTELKIKYFDTIPTASAMCVMKSNGFLFAASEFRNYALYQFQAIRTDPDVESSSTTSIETDEGFQPVLFKPRGLKNLVRIDQMESLMPIMGMKVVNLFEEETPQIFTLCGRGPRSSLRILRPGLAISELAVSQLPGVPSAVWTTVEEVSDSGLFLGTTPSLAVSLIGEDSLMQVYPSGIRHIREDGRIDEWRTPGKQTIVKVGYNRFQVVIALSGGEIIYFEVDRATGLLMEIVKKEVAAEVACLDIAPVPEGMQKSRFLAVGSYDSTMRILSLDSRDCMQVLSLQSVSSPPESLLFLKVEASLFLSVGLQSGVLFRTVVDRVTGQFSNGRSRFLGLRAPKLLSVLVRGKRAMICLSSRAWLGYIHQGLFHLTPLTYVTLKYAASFSSAQCVEGFVAVAGDTLRVLTIDKIGETFNETCVPLRYTPRKFELHPKRELLVTIESDQGAFPAELLESAKKECIEAAGQRDNGKMEIENDVDDDDKYGYPKAESDKWVSCIRVLDPKSTETTCLLELQDNEAAFSICTVNFHDNEFGTLLASFHYCKYRRDENQLYVYADDSVPRWLTSACHVDFDTMAGADKFGNIYFVRLPQDVSDEIEEGPGSIKREQGMVNKVEEIVQFHVGDVVTCMQKASLNPRGVECLVYGTVMGSLGALLPFTSRADVDFFSHLEMHMRQELPRLCGRDHMAYRSAYYPVKDVIDGDLCEQAIFSLKMLSYYIFLAVVVFGRMEERITPKFPVLLVENVTVPGPYRRNLCDDKRRRMRFALDGQGVQFCLCLDLEL
ncbi:splicing factor 3B subunit 3-like protein [Tanacetum coccineum]